MSLPPGPSSHRTADVRRGPRRAWWRTVVGAAAAMFLAVSGATFASGPANAATPADAAAVHADATSAQCLTVKLQSNFWQDGPDSGGLFRDIAITNNCTTAVTGWKLMFVLPPGQTFRQGWNAIWTVDGKILTATPAVWNGTIAAGRSVEIGYIGTWAGSRQDPDCTINDQPCDGTDPGPDPQPTVALTSPTDGSQLMSVCTLRLTADASTRVGTIDRVEFHLNNQLVGSDTSAPYGIDVPPDHPALRGSPQHTAFARVVTVAPAATADSAPVGFTQVTPPPALMVIACPSSVQVPAGGSATMYFTLRACSATPGLGLTVTADAGISVTPLVLPPGSWERRITITAAPGNAGTVARITATTDSGSCMPATARVTIVPAS
ncbi:cellulose binding domain-containing protein [Micromonospora sp. LOL_023]|uniref:cellulose binding domain-containing protein n=1 Tax=Micromonospora sp. LOL_023 TaxID=3345418 RepID=UPI003A8C6F15